MLMPDGARLGCRIWERRVTWRVIWRVIWRVKKTLIQNETFLVEGHLEGQICRFWCVHPPPYRLKNGENTGRGAGIIPLIDRFSACFSVVKGC